MTWGPRVTEGKPLEKIIYRLAGLQMVEQRLHRHPRSIEHSRASHHVAVPRNHRLGHVPTLRRRQRALQYSTERESMIGPIQALPTHTRGVTCNAWMPDHPPAIGSPAIVQPSASGASARSCCGSRM
jgi:hypothetical protein